MKVEKIIIDSNLEDKTFLENLSFSLPVEHLSVEEVRELENTLSYREAKKYLFFTSKKSGFAKPCPGTTNYICCNYAVLNHQEGCSFDCSYCILQGYLKNKIPRIYTNWSDIKEETALFLKNNSYRRIGSGELSDSLVYDLYTNYSTHLIQFFRHFPEIIFEFKTKSVAIDNLLKVENPPSNIMISWSMNTEKIVKNEEHGAASLEERLKAARRVTEVGYKIGFHFDPIFVYEGCIEEYKRTIDLIFSYVLPSDILYISLGVFRYLPFMKDLILQSFPKTKIFQGEFREGLDKKMRYFRPLREKVVSQIVSYLLSYSSQLNLYFCMESARWWDKLLGYPVSSNEEAQKKIDKYL